MRCERSSLGLVLGVLATLHLRDGEGASCVNDFAGRELMANQARLIGGFESMDEEQRIFPEIRFTCQTFISSLSFVAEDLGRGGMRNKNPELQIWRPQGNSYTKIHSTSGSPLLTFHSNVFTYSNIFWAVQANDVLGVYQPEVRKSRYLFLLQERGGPINYQLTDERDAPDSVELNDVSSDESDYPLLSIQLNSTDGLAPRGCDSGFLPFETIRLKGSIYPGRSNAVVSRHNRITIVPGITIGCNGSIRKWTFAAEMNDPSGILQYPSLEVWRRFSSSVVQRRSRTTLQTLSRTDKLNIYEVTPLTPLQVSAGDLLGIYQPSESRSVVSVYYRAMQIGPINYYADGNTLENLLGTFTVNANSMQITHDLPLVNIEIVARCSSLSNPVNGRVQAPSPAADGGSTATYSCNAGYTRQGVGVRTCGSATGEWSGSAPTCNPIDCGVPGSPANGFVTADATTVQSISRYSCAFGYRLSGPTERSCRNNGRWSGSTPTCEVVRCPVLEPPADGGVVVTDDTPDGVAVYSCEGGYHLAGAETRTCVLGGEWSEDEPRCSLIECSHPPVVVNGRTSFSGVAAVNSVAVYSCNEGFELVGLPNITCQADATWTMAPICEIVDCGILSNPDNGSVSLKNGTVFHSVAQYSCDVNFMLNGSAVRICQENETWSFSEPNCMEVRAVETGGTVETVETTTAQPSVQPPSTTVAKTGGVNLADIVVIAVIFVLCSVIFCMAIITAVLFIRRRKRKRMSAVANTPPSSQGSFENPVYQGAASGPSQQWSPTSKPEEVATPLVTRPRARNSYDSGHFLYDQPSPDTSSSSSKGAAANGASVHYGVHSILPPHLYDFPDLDHYEMASNYSASYYETPVSPYEVPTPKTKSPACSFASLPWGIHVPTEDQRRCFTSGGPAVTSSNKNLAFFEETEIYWKPASDTASLYAQFAKNKYREILKKQIQVTEHLGSGQFGMVDKGLWQSPVGVAGVAVKTLKPGSNESDRIKFLQEAAIMGQFQHRNVVKLHGVVTVGEPVMIVLELLLNGDLRNYLLKIRPAPGEMVCSSCPQQLLKFSRDIASGMEYLSGKSFVHRDLAARNILVADDKTTKISDFGLSRDLEDETYYISNGGKIPVKWTAPEALHYKKYSTASDVWSFGVVMYEIWSLGHKPFETDTNSETIRLIDRGVRLLPPPGCPRAVYGLMMHCWHPETSSRPTFSTLLQSLSHLSLEWSREDTSSHPQSATVLGAPLEAGQNLFQDLQNLYQ